MTGLCHSSSHMPNYPVRALGYDVFESNGTLYVPYSNVLLSCGPFLLSAEFLVERHLILPPSYQKSIREDFVGSVRTVSPRLVAAETFGDSMIGVSIYSGDTVLFTQSDFSDWRDNHVAVVERPDAGGFGAWTLKKVVIRRVPFVPKNQFEDDAYWNGPVVELRPANSGVAPVQIDPQGRYRLHGFFKRVVASEDVQFEDSETIRYRAAKK
jgi:hypothetical protein